MKKTTSISDRISKAIVILISIDSLILGIACIVALMNVHRMIKAGLNPNPVLYGSFVFIVLYVIASMLVASKISKRASRRIAERINAISGAAEKIATGNLDIVIDTDGEDETGNLAKSFEHIVSAVKGLREDIGMLISAAAEGDLNRRADPSKQQGDYRKVIEGVNHMLDTLVGQIDSMPTPIMTMDTDFSVKYINKAGADLLKKPQEELKGQKCFELFKSGDCNTGSCACALAMKEGIRQQSETEVCLFGKKHDISYFGMPLKDTSGTVIGAYEFLNDLTQVKAAERLSEKQLGYQAAEVDKLVVSFGRLARGELDCDIQVAPADEDTIEIHKNFEKLGSNLHAGIGAIKGYIDDLTQVLGEISRGNLDVGITKEYQGDFIELKQAVNDIIASFNGMLREISVTAEQVAEGTDQVSAGSQELSQGATEQAGAIEELTAAVEEIADQTRKNATGATRASGHSRDAREHALTGNDRMKDLQQAMAEISEASDNISKIIKVIDEIAFQTNILALNASVEAARAGQYGKGFSVVAEEVRNLAQRSAASASETTALIEGSIEKVRHGTKLADEAAQALDRIVAGIEEVDDLVAAIAKASGDQATASAQVSAGIEQVSQVVQTNSATAQESAATSEELSSHATILKDMVSRFSFKE